MRDRAPERFGLAVALLAAAAAGVLAAGAGATEDPARAEGFQRLVGGLGGGTATSLVPCERAFDPARAEGCALGTEPLPGGFDFCPHHSGPTIRR